MIPDATGPEVDSPKRAGGAGSFVWGMVEALGACGVACTLAGFAGGMHWLIELTSHFRVQYLVLLLATGGLLAIGRRFKAATVFLAGALVNAVVLAPWLLPASKVKPDGKALRVMVLNVYRCRRKNDF